ncbi:hypothetical protein KVR01_010424 [Diaporthe batatas]|uniref:uncharacterized protein n=1 Tax=Diaporthe batatas TaxID=748121 RepID=UPI001D03EF30|nr:uncharacterized protein KVR01_010424 [Diaporthe batatas]KAG8159787.1 hypothetical protein KVR01_010424 [Diaporthe batatas]
MPCQFMVDRLLQASTAVAFTGFLVLCAQALDAIYKLRKRKRQARAEGPVALSGVTSGDEPHKPRRDPDTTPDGQPRPPLPPPEPAAEKGPDNQGTRRPLHDRKDALIAQARDLRCGDTTPEISHVICAYLSAAEDLLKLNRAGSGPEGGLRGGVVARRTDAELNAAAAALVRETTDAVKSLQAKADRKGDSHVPARLAAVCAVAIWSMLAVMAAAFAAEAAEEQVLPGGRHIDLTRFTLRGEPRAYGGGAGAAGAVLAPVILECLRAAAYVSKAISDGSGLFLSLILYPADAAFGCLASTLLLLGLPLGVHAVYVLSMVCIFVMAIVAGACVAIDADAEDDLDVAGGQEQGAG